MSKGFGFPAGNMQGLVKQAQKMQEELKKAQESSAQFVAEGSAGGGMVKVTAKGDNTIVSVVIDPEVVTGSDLEMLQDLVMAAVNDALERVQENVKQEMAKVTGGLSIPGLI